MNALNPSHAALVAEVTALRATLSDAVELVESLRAERDALRAALDLAAHKLDCRYRHADVATMLRAALERSAP